MINLHFIVGGEAIAQATIYPSVPRAGEVLCIENRHYRVTAVEHRIRPGTRVMTNDVMLHLEAIAWPTP